MAVIRSIETAVPAATVHQPDLRDLLREQPGYGRLGRRLVTAAFDASAIDTRHSVLAEFDQRKSASDPSVAADPGLFDIASGIVANPGTAARNDAYTLYSKPLLVEAARKAIAAVPDLTVSEITHVVTVSCTGFYAPGPDYVLVRELGLSPSVQRFHLGFMGCYAAFPALKMAAQFCDLDPDAVVLVVSVELCSLHLHVDDDPDAIVAASVFGDGGAAAVVVGSAHAGPDESPRLDLDAFETTIIADGAADMAWTIGDHGFDMVLSSYVPRIVEQNIGAAVSSLLARSPGLEVADVPFWAIHPGGRSILDRVETALALDEPQVAASRKVLREHGNMSSATVLFVLRELLVGAEAPVTRELVAVGAEAGARAAESGDRGSESGSWTRRVCAMAFGPGLTVETALLTLRGGE